MLGRWPAMVLAGGMVRGRGPTLAERSTTWTPAEVTADPDLRHCRTGLGRWAGLLAEWRQDIDAGGWQGRVGYAVDDGGSAVLAEAWVHARHRQPVIS